MRISEAGEIRQATKLPSYLNILFFSMFLYGDDTDDIFSNKNKWDFKCMCIDGNSHLPYEYPFNLMNIYDLYIK